MKSNQNDPRHEGYSRDRSNHKHHDDFNILEPSPDSNLNFMEDEDYEITGFAFLDYPDEQDFAR